MEFHFIDVGIGNMVLGKMPNGKIICCDCNVTEDNEDRVYSYVNSIIGGNKIDVFINTHRDADHMRGIEKLNRWFGIEEIWDSNVTGTTTDSSEYETYMNLRQEIGATVKAGEEYTFGDCLIKIMNGQNDNFSDANDQSLVVKFEYGGSGVTLAGDTSFRSWKEFILPYYPDSSIDTEILMVSHHGSISFFDDPSDLKNYYTEHIKKINPAISIVSVGDNVHDLPNEKALELYEKYSRGSNKGNKVFRTDLRGTIKLVIDGDGSWTLN